MSAPLKVKDPNGYLARAAEYKRWAAAQPRTPTLGAPMNAPPTDYAFLAQFPNNFKDVRSAFEMYWAVKRLTGR